MPEPLLGKIDVEVIAGDEAPLIKMYWQQNEDLSFAYESAELCQNEQLTPANLAKRVKKWGRASIAGTRCSRCENPCIVGTRTDYRNLLAELRAGRDVECTPCRDEIARQARENDRRKTDERIQERENIRDAVVTNYAGRRRITSKAYTHSFESLAFLLTLKKAGLLRGDTVSPIWSATLPVSHSTQFTHTRIVDLVRSGILRFDPDAPWGRQVNSESTFSNWEYIRALTWTLGRTADEAAEFVSEATSLLFDPHWPTAWLAAALALIEEVAVGELWRSAGKLFATEGFSLVASDGDYKRLRTVVELLPHAQAVSTLGFCLGEAKVSVGSVGSTAARDEILNSWIRLSQYATRENWTITPVPRLERSAFSATVSEVLLGSAEVLSYYTVPAAVTIAKSRIHSFVA
jgi:hypothetical protein